MLKKPKNLYFTNALPTSVLFIIQRNVIKKLKKQIKKLTTLPRLLYGANRYSLLLIFQAMDAAWKGDVIRHVCLELIHRDVKLLVLNTLARLN
jgi:polyphosphate kinase 2 (PPK2 family)